MYKLVKRPVRINPASIFTSSVVVLLEILFKLHFTEKIVNCTFFFYPDHSIYYSSIKYFNKIERLNLRTYSIFK